MLSHGRFLDFALNLFYCKFVFLVLSHGKWGKPFGQGKNGVFPSPYVQLRLEHASLRDASAANAQIFSSRTTSAISLRETEKIRPPPPSPLPLPFPKSERLSHLGSIAHPRIIWSFSKTGAERGSHALTAITFHPGHRRALCKNALR